MVSEIPRPAVGDRHGRAPEPVSAQLTEAVPRWRPSPSLAALEDVIEVAQALPERVARRGGLSVTELHALRVLSRRSVGPVELARRLGVTSAASSGVVDRLVARGHAERQPHAVDRRRTDVVVTASGRREVIAQLRPMFEGLAALDGELTEEEREVVSRYLLGVLDAMRRLL